MSIIENFVVCLSVKRQCTNFLLHPYRLLHPLTIMTGLNGDGEPLRNFDNMEVMGSNVGWVEPGMHIILPKSYLNQK